MNIFRYLCLYAAKKRHANNSESIRVNWKRSLELMKLFAGDTPPFSKIDNRFAGDTPTFSKIDNRLAEDFRMFLMTTHCGGNKSGTISRNTAATYNNPP
ncbi:MAG: phage integrase SAM-like domain-containing protein [Tannerella sp.]|nr:phage integrase SAM-like domain-containing protein [Tannerella sp.]